MTVADAKSLLCEPLSQCYLYPYRLTVLGLTIGWAVSTSALLGKPVNPFLAFYAIF